MNITGKVVLTTRAAATLDTLLDRLPADADGDRRRRAAFP
ncbi:MAG: hypothetical protein FD176_2654 [Rhodospirillaceae bacterium]|nr:MAG: hypothetical protein FD176_2654 [Rhodospirillaceae bacterium]TNC96350.1 MAG: hypothetical protein FD119_1657 [Stygiobacter sp.]